MNRSPSQIKQKTTTNLRAQSYEIDLNRCCVFENPYEWKCITKPNTKTSKTFLKLTIGTKKPEEQIGKHLESKQTRSRSLSSQSSQVFEQAKNDFIEQLKLFRGQSSNSNPQISQYGQIEASNKQYLRSNYKSDRKGFIEDFEVANEAAMKQVFYRSWFNKINHRRWMERDLQSIQEVETYFEATQGLNSQNSSFHLHQQSK